jgi:NAD(P)-dependent dehydrogenase (short-subunit alcohol dehydrogenase family)
MKMGAQVAVHYNTNQKAAERLVANYPKTGSMTVQADLAQAEEVAALFDTVKAQLGRIDVIILNAGVFIEHPVELSTDEWLKIWKQTLAINLDAVGILTKMGLAHFMTNKEGRFIYISSRAAFRGETEEYLAYAASKGGMVSLARSVARSFGKDNIKAFSIAPGFVRTQMAKDFIAKHGEERVLNEIALNSLTEPEDLTPLVGLMCSGLMDHATGATIDMNAGSHIR